MTSDPLSAFTIARLDDGRPALHWRGHNIAMLTKAKSWLEPQLALDRGLDLMPLAEREALAAHMKMRLTALIARHLGPLMRLDLASRDPAIPVPVRALFIRLVEQGGFVSRDHAADLIDALDPAARRLLRQHKLELGNLALFMPAMVRHQALTLWQMLAGLQGVETARIVPEGLPSRVILAAKQPCPWPYLPLGGQALRLDLAERLLRAAHDQRVKQAGPAPKGTKAPGFALAEDQALSMGISIDSHHRLLRLGGFSMLPPSQNADDATPPPRLWRWRGRRSDRARPIAAKPQHARGKIVTPSAVTPPVRPALRPGNAFAALADWPGFG